MKTAIEKAVEGGYRFGEMATKDLMNYWFAHQGTILIDPLFWQALGKVMGWQSYWYGFWDTVVEDERGWRWHPKEVLDRTHRQTSNLVMSRDGWEHHWHRFIDHLAEGKDAESFFKELLK